MKYEKDLKVPGVYIEEVQTGTRPIQPVGTSTAGFLGVAPDHKKYTGEPRYLTNWTQFLNQYFPKEGVEPEEGKLDNCPPDIKLANWTPLAHAVYGFFFNGGSECYVVNLGKKDEVETPTQDKGLVKEPLTLEQGLKILERIDEIAILAAPGYTEKNDYIQLTTACEKLEDRVAILDGPDTINDYTLARFKNQDGTKADDQKEWGMPNASKRGFNTLYAPWIMVANPDPETNEKTPRVKVPPSGHVAGIWARSDATRGVHKAPANEPVRGALKLEYQFSHQEHGALNILGVNCIREFAGAGGILVWGARTLAVNSLWRYLNLRRLFNQIEESIEEGTRWIVFEPNDRPLWQAIKRDVTAFLMNYWRNGALRGRTPEEAFFVKCDEENNPFDRIKNGEVHIDIGIAPVFPAEFVIFHIFQKEDGAEVDMR
jgi:uncharacterized protein